MAAKEYEFDETLAAQIVNGAVGVLPTDTVYGLVARAADPRAVGKILALKNRDQKPGTLIAVSIAQLTELGIKARYLKAVEHFWPGAVSVVIPMEPTLQHLHRGKFSLPVRIPGDARLAAFLAKTGPLMTTSANRPGEPPAATIAEAKEVFGDKVDFYVDGGNRADAPPSTIIRIVDDAVEVLRQGSVIIDEKTGRIIS